MLTLSLSLLQVCVRLLSNQYVYSDKVATLVQDAAYLHASLTGNEADAASIPISHIDGTILHAHSSHPVHAANPSLYRVPWKVLNNGNELLLLLGVGISWHLTIRF